MIEAVMFWNEPNNKSHWAFEVDPEWRTFAEMVKGAGLAVAAENPRLLRVLGGISPIDPGFVRRMEQLGVLETVDIVALHGFPLDWNLWAIDEWPEKLREIQAVTNLPIWITEVGASSFGAEEVQVFGLNRTAELLAGRVPRIFWYSSTTCRAPGRRQPGTAKRRDRPTTAIFTWDCCARTARRSSRSSISIGTRPASGFANGSISRITGWMKP